MQCLFVTEGTSDSGISRHIVEIAAEKDIELYMSSPDFGLLQNKVGYTIAAKLDAARKLGGEYDVIAVHRDSDNVDPALRRQEIERAVDSVFGSDMPRIPIVPQRMTEAWLLLDEAAIRRVAGNPNGKIPLNLPGGAATERMADPKAFLKSTLATASEATGRRLKILNGRFGENRALLLELLDRSGPVADLSSWRAFEDAITAAIV